MKTLKLFLFLIYFIWIFISAYIIIGNFFSYNSAVYSVLGAAFIIYMIVLVIFGIKNIRQSGELFKNNDVLLLRKYSMIIKLVPLPFFIINIALFVFSLIATRGVIMVLVPVFLLFYLFFLIITSSYSISFILALKRMKLISPTASMINIFFQLFGITDMAGMTFLTLKTHHLAKEHK